MGDRTGSPIVVALRISLVALGLASTLCLAGFAAVRGAESSGPTGASEAPRNGPLMNAGFESEDPQQGWTLHVYGAQPTIAEDPTIRHEGCVSLRISADEPSDTALGQEVDLQPGRWYCLSGWIRTEKLDPRGSPTCGTLQVQLPGGQGVVAAGKNHPGTSDWIQESIYFTPPGDGRTRISVFFVGYGKGTGTAWFDGLSVHEMDAVVSKLTLTSEPNCRAKISPYQYGQFIEYLCGLTPSMFAEQVFDGSFEGVPPYRVEFRQDTDRLEKPWYPDGAVHRGDFALDSGEAFNGTVSQRITQKPGDPCTLGVSQAGKHVDSGRTAAMSLSPPCPRTVSRPYRWRSGATARPMPAPTFQPTEQWRRFETILQPTDTDPFATLSISFRGPGTALDRPGLADDDRQCLRLATRRGRSPQGSSPGHHSFRRQHDRRLRLDRHDR